MKKKKLFKKKITLLRFIRHRRILHIRCFKKMIAQRHRVGFMLQNADE